MFLLFEDGFEDEDGHFHDGVIIMFFVKISNEDRNDRFDYFTVDRI